MANKLKIYIGELNTNKEVVKNFDFFTKPDFYINIIVNNQRYSTPILYDTYNGTFDHESSLDIGITDILCGITIKLELCEKDTSIIPKLLQSENIIGNAYIQTKNLQIDKSENKEITFGENIGTLKYELKYEINLCKTLLLNLKKYINI